MSTQDRIRFMRVIVFFDLPVVTAQERKAYRVFRKFLLKEGFLMIQKSVYSKLSIDDAHTQSIIQRLRKNRPPAGLVQALKVTEKQYSSMEYIVGKHGVQSELDTIEDFVVL